MDPSYGEGTYIWVRGGNQSSVRQEKEPLGKTWVTCSAPRLPMVELGCSQPAAAQSESLLDVAVNKFPLYRV